MADLGIQNLYESSADSGNKISVDIPEPETTCLDISESEITHIPIDLLNQKREAYEPSTVSLGPFHFGQSNLDKSEQNKKQLLSRRYPYRVSHFQKLVDCMMHDEFTTRIRKWYSNTDSVPEAGKLGSMMALDGIFLLQVLREISPMSDIERSLGFTEIQPFADLEYILNLEENATRLFQLLLQPFTRVQEDIMKLQNQIPFFALNMIIQWEKKTYQAMTEMMLQQKAGKEKNKILQQKAGKGKEKMPQQKAGKEKDKMLEDMIIHAPTDTNQDLNSILKRALQSLSPFPDMQDREDSDKLPVESSHILGFVYINIVGSPHSTSRSQSSEMRKNKRDLPVRAVVLDNKGVKFAALKGPLRKIRFDGKACTFHLPRIEIDHRTDTVMRNLLAFELYVCLDKTKPIMCYVELMDQLIDTAEDVGVLKKYGIIHHHLGTDQEVANMWNEMRKGHEKKCQYEPIDTAIEDVIKFYKSYRIWYAECMQKYFSKPWLVVSLIVACIFVVTSVLQTILAWEQLRH